MPIQKNKNIKKYLTPFINHSKRVKYDLGYKVSLALRDKERIMLHLDLEDRYVFRHIYRGDKFIFKYMRFDRLNFPKMADYLLYWVTKGVPFFTFLKTTYDEDLHAITLTFEFADLYTTLDIRNKNNNYSELARKLEMLLIMYREVLIKKLNDGDDVDERRARGGKEINPLSVYRA